MYQILNGNDKYRGDPDAKILIASQSHVAVDHSLAKIKKLIPDIKMIRVGILDKLADSSKEYTLDIFCRRWTQKVIENCKKALAKYKQEIGIDDSLQEKNSIINEIENITQEISKLAAELKNVEDELERVNILDSKWCFVNEKIAIMKQKIAAKATNVTEEYLSQVIENFVESLSELNNQLDTVIDESVALSERKVALQERYVSINEKLGEKGHELNEWKHFLNVSSNEEYVKIKEDIQAALKENKKKYASYSRVEVYAKNGKKGLHREMDYYKKVLQIQHLLVLHVSVLQV